MKKAIVILGMHKSGTSMIANILQFAGVNLGDDLREAAFENLFGYFENKEILDLNIRMLKKLGGSWNAPPELKEGWEDDSKLEEFYSEAESLIKDLFKNSEIVAFKDPRTTILTEFWHKVLSSLQVKIDYLFIFRNPVEVAKSLERRNEIKLPKGIELWRKYNQHAISFFEKNQVKPVISRYEDLLNDSVKESYFLFKELEIYADENAYQNIHFTVMPDLRHSEFKDDDESINSSAKEVLGKIKSLYSENKKSIGSFDLVFKPDKDFYIKKLKELVMRLEKNQWEDRDKILSRDKNANDYINEIKRLDTRVKDLENKLKIRRIKIRKLQRKWKIALLPIAGQIFALYLIIKKLIRK